MIHRVAMGFVLAVIFELAPFWVQQQARAAEQGSVPVAGNGGAPPSPVVATPQATAPTPGEDVTKPLRREVVMARIGDEKITVDDFMKYVSQDSRLLKMATTDQGKAQVLREMILDRLIEIGMRREGFLPTDHPPNQTDYLRGYNLLAAKYFPDANKTPDEEKIHQYYLEHREAFGIPAMVRVGQIQFRVPASASPQEIEAVKARADATLKRLRAGESFAVLAGALTENPQGRVAEGDLGFLPVNQDAWLRKAVADLAPGQYSEVLESPVGYEIIQLKDKRDALVTPYANARGTVLAQMRREAMRQGSEAYAWRLAKEVGVTVEINELKSALPQTTP
ncbi:MAG: peptidyl-prolyl cis-trans isomerase [Candidatus Competibacter sp.]|nr:peptidyl-prolyl cis-trans isomerase [Candidatus Competibacter sp.]MDG4584068.1 peptidyl-prolyl cis-trans isomerase [Candidatus Competibacter sp.]